MMIRLLDSLLMCVYFPCSIAIRPDDCQASAHSYGASVADSAHDVITQDFSSDYIINASEQAQLGTREHECVQSIGVWSQKIRTATIAAERPEMTCWVPLFGEVAGGVSMRADARPISEKKCVRPLGHCHLGASRLPSPAAMEDRSQREIGAGC